MKKEKYILAIDHGTSGIKAAVVSVTGKVVDFDFEATPVIYLPNGGVEQDPDLWWSALISASKKVLNRGVVKAEEIVGVSVSSTFSSIVAVDKSGKSLMNSVTWMDSRGAPYIKKMASGFPSVDGYNIFKAMKWIRITGGGPSLSGKDDIAHILFIKSEFPQIYDKTYKFLESKDYLNLKFTGEFSASFDSIMLFWVTDIRDINNIKYSDTLIKEFGIDRDKLPNLKQSIDILGKLKPEIAHELGLSRDVKVISGSPDHQAALVGSGAIKDYEGHLYIGTSSWLETIVPFKKTDMFHQIATLPTAIPGKYQCINEQDIAGGCLSFLLNNIICHKNEFYRDTIPDHPYEKLSDIANRVPAGSGNLIFTPWLNGERTPVDSTTLRGGFHNLSLTATTDHIVRAVLEGVAFNTRWSLKYVEKFIKRKMDIINIIGGGAQSDIWCQIFADVFGRNIRRVKDPIQTNARGAAFIASVGLGYIDFNDIPDIIEYDGIFEPDLSNKDIYDKLFREFLNIHKMNKGIYERLNSYS